MSIARSVWRAAACFAAVLLPAPPAPADGAFFVSTESTLESIAVNVDQRAIVMRCGDTVRLTLSMGYSGSGGDFAWIIPTPAAPSVGDVKEADTDGGRTFDVLDMITAVRAITGWTPLRGAPAGVGGPDRVSAPLVDVRGRITLAHYEASILTSTDAAGLLDWLKANGYAVCAASAAVLADYICEGWSFVAVKLRPTAVREYRNEFLPPIEIQYQSDRLTFPLRISSAGARESARITIYVIAESTVSAANLPTVPLRFDRPLGLLETPPGYIDEGIRAVVGGRGLAVMWSGAYEERAYTDARNALQQSFEGTPGSMGLRFYEDDPFLCDEVLPFFQEHSPACRHVYLTRLEARMDPSAMTEDILLSLDASPRALSIVVQSERALKTR
jgi:hypothetical protein